MAVGDVGAVERLAAEARFANRAARRLERALARKRKSAPNVVQVSAVRASRFSTRGMRPSGRRLLDAVCTRLISSKLTGTGRHAFLVSSVCDDAALLVAPKRHGASLRMARSEATATTMANAMHTANVAVVVDTVVVHRPIYIDRDKPGNLDYESGQGPFGAILGVACTNIEPSSPLNKKK